MAENSAGRGYVLIVDDDGDIREAIGDLLGDEEVPVRLASNGEEGLKVIDDHGPPSVILLDWMMPIMDGSEFRKRQLARPEWALVPTILFTASGSLKAAAAGFDGVLAKPFSADALIQVVRRYVPS